MLGLTIVPAVLSEGCGRSISATASVREALAPLAASGNGAIAVNDGAGRLAGILGAHAVIQLLAEGRDLDRLTVAEIMTGAADPLAPQDGVLDALELMLIRGARHLAVMDEDRLVGLIGAQDVLPVLARALAQSFGQAEAALFGPAAGETHA